MPIGLDDSVFAGGLFSVDKKGPIPKGYMSLQRLIFNLRVPNSIQRPILSDLYELPVGLSFEFVLLEDYQYLLVSSEDVRSAFYLYQLPAIWAKYLCVSRKANITLRSCQKVHKHIGCITIPMGWLSAVGICQSLHRRLIKGSLGGQVPPSVHG